MVMASRVCSLFLPNRNTSLGLITHRILNNSRFSTTTSSSSDGAGGVITHPLSSSCSLKLQRGDITRWSVDGVTDAIVNTINQGMLRGGEVDDAIRRAAGPELEAACYDFPEVHPKIRCPIGEARITRAFKLPVSRVIHTAAPIADADFAPENLLKNSYRSCLKLAKENNIQYIAFPSIGCCSFGFTYPAAARIAITTVKEFANEFKEVHFVLFTEDTYDSWLEGTDKWL